MEKTGTYHLWFVTCDPALQAAAVQGATSWKNPTGTAARQTLCPHAAVSSFQSRRHAGC